MFPIISYAIVMQSALLNLTLAVILLCGRVVDDTLWLHPLWCLIADLKDLAVRFVTASIASLVVLI
jgi:hypothetical protein